MSESASERLSRLLALVPWLLAHDGVTVEECAAHFGVSAQQLERDLWLLVVCGVPGYGPDQLVDIQFWDDGVIHVLDPQTLDRPLQLTHEEAVTLLVALRMLAQLPGIEDRDAIITAAAKIERVASEGASERYVAVQVNVPPEVTHAVDQALGEGGDLHLVYAAATRDEVTERIVRPERLLVVDGIGYLEAYCTSAGARRTFRLDRVISARPARAAADAPDDGREPREDETAALTIAVLEVRPPARWIIDVHGGSVVEERADGGARVRLPLHSLDWGLRLVLSLKGAAVVEEPPELVAEVAHSAQAALAAYPDDVG